MCLFLGLLTLEIPQAFAQKPKDPKWTHAFDFMVRKYGESEFDEKKTQKFGVEVFKEPNTGYGLYITQAGYYGAAPGFDAIDGPIKNSKGGKWTGGLDLPARKPGDKEFTDKTKAWSMETYYDPNANNWIYITEFARIAVIPGPAPAAGGALKAPKWSHSFDLRCRKGGNPKWKDAIPFGIEVYKDPNTGMLIYICDNGSIAVIGDSETKPAAGKDPEWLHGLDIKCRRHDEPDFTKDTKIWGVEVFRDTLTGNLVYLSEEGTLAVAPAGKKDLKAPTPDVKHPKWTQGLNLAARKVGEKEFSKTTKVYGGEVFQDLNTGLTLFILETGSLTAAPTK